MNANVFLPAVATALAVACATNAPSDELARELAMLESTKPAPAVRIARGPITKNAIRDAAYRPTGTPCALRYALTDGSGGRRVVIELIRGEQRISLRNGDEAWFFERNPFAPEEVTGFRVDRERALLVEYPFSDLRLEGYASSWSSLARLGVDPRELERLEPTGETVERFGLVFTQLADASAGGAEVRELAWNDEHDVALRVVRASGARVELESFARSSGEPASAREAHPDFAVRDIADWRESVHDHGH